MQTEKSNEGELKKRVKATYDFDNRLPADEREILEVLDEAKKEFAETLLLYGPIDLDGKLKPFVDYYKKWFGE